MLRPATRVRSPEYLAAPKAAGRSSLDRALRKAYAYGVLVVCCSLRMLSQLLLLRDGSTDDLRGT